MLFSSSINDSPSSGLMKGQIAIVDHRAELIRPLGITISLMHIHIILLQDFINSY